MALLYEVMRGMNAIRVRIVAETEDDRLWLDSMMP